MRILVTPCDDTKVLVTAKVCSFFLSTKGVCKIYLGTGPGLSTGRQTPFLRKERQARIFFQIKKRGTGRFFIMLEPWL